MAGLSLFFAALALAAATPDAAPPGGSSGAPFDPSVDRFADLSLDRWRPQIAEASARFGVPEPWIERVMRAESAGRTMRAGRPIRSRAGAIGLMQLMPATWAEMRDRLGLGDDPDDPRANILAGTLYLRLMHERFGYPGLFAAYNAGPGRFADHLAGRRRLPAETILYLDKVAGARIAGERIGKSGGLFVELGGAPPPDIDAAPRDHGGGLFVDLRGR